MSKNINYIVFLVSLFFITADSFAQDGVSVSASVNKSAIIIGEPIELKLEATIPHDVQTKWFSLDSLTHFEVIDKAKIDTANNGSYKQLVTITSFDSGLNVIPPISLDINGKIYLTDSIPVMVSFTPFDPKQDYHDIKDILEVEAVKESTRNRVLLGAIIVAIILIIWFLVKKYRKKKVGVKDADAVRLTPFEEAMKALDDLKKQSLSEKEFYTGINDVVRWFTLRKTGIFTMQKTNEEFILQLDELKLPQADFIQLIQVLRMADAVKFAKFIPTPAEKEESYQVIRRSIEQINNINNSAV